MLLQIDGTLIVLAISFIIFLFIMQAIFYGPMRAVKTEREKYIHANKKMAESAKIEGEKIIAKKQQRIMEARKLASEKVAKSTHEASLQKATVVESAKKDAQQEIDKCKSTFAEEAKIAKEELKNDVLVLAQSISTKILGKEVPISGVSAQVVEQILGSEIE